MTEIVRMTTQIHPLEVGIPLYPFSHASVFAKEARPMGMSAPLPDSRTFEEVTQSTGLSHTSALELWSSPELMQGSIPTLHYGLRR